CSSSRGGGDEEEQGFSAAIGRRRRRSAVVWNVRFCGISSSTWDARRLSRILRRQFAGILGRRFAGVHAAIAKSKFRTFAPVLRIARHSGAPTQRTDRPILAWRAAFVRPQRSVPRIEFL